MKNKKLMLFIPRMGNGGAERVMATIANYFVNKNNEVLLMTLTDTESFYDLDDRVKVIAAEYKINKNNKVLRTVDLLLNGIKSLFYLKKQVDIWQPDYVISFLTHTNLIATIVKLFSGKFNLIVSERAEPNERGLVTKYATKFLYGKANFIVCQSEKVKNFFKYTDDDKLVVIENPLNIDSLPITKPESRKKKIVGVGRLFEQKNFELLINSFSDIENKFPDYELEIYGDGHLKSVLEQQIVNLNLQHKIFLQGVKKNVMKEIYDYELFVMSSNFEGFPNALIEAMASGLPVISTDFSTGVAKDLIDDDNGIVVPVNDRKALADAMEVILANDDARSAMSKNNWELRNKLAPEKIMSKWESILDGESLQPREDSNE